MQSQEKIVFRLDDVGASSKRFDVYGREVFSLFGKNIPVSRVSNFFFMKYIPPFKKWAPYRELNVPEWLEILKMLREFKARMTVGMTASWVERDQRQAPFPVKFPGQAAVIREGVQAGLIEVANHGLTHCVP